MAKIVLSLLHYLVPVCSRQDGEEGAVSLRTIYTVGTDIRAKRNPMVITGRIIYVGHKSYSSIGLRKKSTNSGLTHGKTKLPIDA